MKTRTNQPIDLIVVSNDKIKQLTDAQCNSLKQGDIVLKKTGKQYHAYIVSYKGEGTGEGMCLTYTASGYIETISYDFTGGHWVYNSTDIFNADAKADKTYVDTELAKKANLSGASFTGAITSPSIIEDMSGYSASKATTEGWTNNIVYIGAVKNGNKLTVVVATKMTKTDESAIGYPYVAYVSIPADIHNKLYPFSGSMLDYQIGVAFAPATQTCRQYVEKASNNRLAFGISSTSGFVLNTEYYIRFEATFLLSDSLIQGE